MNLIDIGVLAVLAMFLLAGYYRGFLCTLFDIGAFIVSSLIGYLFGPMLASAIRGSENLYRTMLYYTEGSEFVTSAGSAGVELARTDIANVSSEQLLGVMQTTKVPFPFDERIRENIATEAFAGDSVTALGDYFNLTIVNVSISIVSFLVVFMVARLVLVFVIQLFDYAQKGYPMLHTADGLVGAGFGVIRAFLALFLIFMVLPLMLVIFSDLILPFVETSFFAEFFYTSNFMLSFI